MDDVPENLFVEVDPFAIKIFNLISDTNMSKIIWRSLNLVKDVSQLYTDILISFDRLMVIDQNIGWFGHGHP